MKNQESLEELNAQLRQANQSLVIASIQAKELQDQAEETNLRQKEFLSMLAHELRNPLAPISMASEMLEKIETAHPQLPNIQNIISRQVGNMKRLLEDLLDASRMSTGKITLLRSPILLAEVFRNAAEIAQPSLDRHHQKLVVDIPSQPITLNGDALRLSQVISNLLLNSSKYAPEPDPITLSARLISRNTKVEISVKDKGVGIEPEVQPFIFDLFTQSPRTLDRSEGGMGVGLAMVRTLVELHGGTVEVRSEGRGKGSEFIVVLPVSHKAIPAAPSPNPQAQPSSRARILIVEDNVDGNETLSFCLKLEGHEVDSAFDGAQGLEMAKSGHYDIICCDIGLPVMDGYQMLKQVRLHCFDPVPCCIAMTGYDQQNYRERATGAGFDHFLVKPVSMDGLLEIIAARSTNLADIP
jgi:two-component system, sensor histidine kinase